MSGIYIYVFAYFVSFDMVFKVDSDEGSEPGVFLRRGLSHVMYKWYLHNCISRILNFNELKNNIMVLF